MSRRIDLLTGRGGLSVVWVDDRVHLAPDEIQHIIGSDWGVDQGVTEASLPSLNNTWAAAVRNNAVYDLAEGVSQDFARAAIILKNVCDELHCNLSVVDFRTAQSECFGKPNTLFLLDLQNDTMSLGFTNVNGSNIDKKWDWGIYGAWCVLHYKLSKSRYRFLSRFRSESAQSISKLLPTHFGDYGEAEQWSLKHDDLVPLERKFKAFVKSNLIHADPDITELLLWFIDLPLSGDAAENHTSLGCGEALQQIKKRFGKNFDSESAKSLFLGAPPWKCAPSPEYPICVDDLGKIFTALQLDVRFIDIQKLDRMRLPCQPGLPFALSLKALIHEMQKRDGYKPPVEIQISRENTTLSEYTYTLTLILEKLDCNGCAVSMERFKESYNKWVDAGRQPEKVHFTRQRIGDVEFCKVPLTGGAILGGKEAVVSGTGNRAVSVSFGDQLSPCIKFYWKAKDA